MSVDRAGGIRRRARIKPPAVNFSVSFTPPPSAPTPFQLKDLGAHAAARGFADGDTDQAQIVLETIGFQHASSYFDLFKDDTGTIPQGSSMKELHRALIFDRKLQALLLEYIGLFELKFRAQYSYHMSQARGAFAHRNPKNFKDEAYFKKFLATYQGEFKRQLAKRNEELERALTTYGDAPIWLAVEIMSFGTLSKLFNNTKSKAVRKGVSAAFRATPEELTSWIHALTDVRNKCAHFGRLCGTKLTTQPKRVPGIKGDNTEPFYIIPLLIYLLGDGTLFPDEPELSYDLALLCDTIRLLHEYDDILSRCGLPADWEQLVYNRSLVDIESTPTVDFLNRPRSYNIWLTAHSSDGSVRIG